MKWYEIIRRFPLALFLPVQALLLFVRLDLLPVWGDEQFTLNVIALEWGEIAGVLQADIHPPLYFYALKGWATLWGDPGIVPARALSALVLLAATVLVDRLLLIQRGPRLRFWFLALWTLAPVLVLYGRMARSYSLQILAATVALHFGLKLVENPVPRRAAQFGVAMAALLYVHYLPGLAVGGAVGLFIIFRSIRRRDRELIVAGLGAGAICLALFAPWLPTLLGGIGRAADAEIYALTSNAFSETMLRVGYTAVSWLGGEAQSSWLLVLTLLVGVALTFGLVRNVSSLETGVKVAALAALLGFVGAANWVSFPFMPARLLFATPALLLGCVAALRTPTLVVWLAVMAVGNVYYFQQVGFMNKGYLIPFDSIAAEIRASDVPARTLVFVDAVNADPKPLVAALAGEVPIVQVMDGSAESDQMSADVRTIWHLHHSHGEFSARLRARLGGEFSEVERGYLAYSNWERWLLVLVGRDDRPTHHYSATKWNRR